MKVVWETHKIFGDDSLRVSCTAVRIPTMRAHSEAITLELERPADPEEVRELLRRSPGVKVVDDPEAKLYPMPLTSSGEYDVEVGRIRSSLVFDGGLDLFVSGDQLLKGAALNAVQIAEYLQQKGALSGTASPPEGGRKTTEGAGPDSAFRPRPSAVPVTRASVLRAEPS